jgi:hypothetical protein
MGNISFWTRGKEFTNLVRDFIQSGEFDKSILILKDGGMTNDMILDFFDGKLKLVGDTREGDLEIKKSNYKKDLLFTGWNTLCDKYHRERYQIKQASESRNKDFKALFSIISKEDFILRYKYQILENEGYKIYKQPPLYEVHDGVITRDGYFVECGFQGHSFLYPVLKAVGLASMGSWMDDNYCLHISSKAYSGKVCYNIKHPYLYEEVTLTDTQIQAVANWREHFNSFYVTGEGTMMNALRNYIIATHKHGAKYGNLKFLEQFYDFKIPQIDIEPFGDVFCIRTSPKYSIPGILNSKFGVTQKTLDKALKEIDKDWQVNKDLRANNECDVFYQEFLQGINGVCHYKEKGDFTFDVGEQHEVVQGKQTSTTADFDIIHHKLRPIARQLYEELGKQIQLEFVIKDDQVYIVQLRTIKTPKFESSFQPVEGALICTGFSFTEGYEKNIALEDCIVVQNEVESNEVLGKKAIIVRDKTEFSHALALSQAFGIPSIYGIGDIELPERITINTKDKTGTILKP